MCRVYQAGRHAAEKAAKCPEPLCPTRVLPPLERRGPSPGRALPLLRRSYWLMCRSRWALSSFGFLASFGESLQVVTSPCCPRQLPDVISDSLSLDAGSPTPAVPPCACACFFHGVIGLPQRKVGRLPASVPLETTSCGGRISRTQIFRYVPASKFARPPDRPYRCEYSRRAAGAFTSEQNAVRCLPAHRICYPIGGGSTPPALSIDFTRLSPVSLLWSHPQSGAWSVGFRPRFDLVARADRR